MQSLVPFACRLPSRRLLRVRGTDAHEFLQGIFTNDLRSLHPAGSMYGCFLYFTGRVMCDAQLYQCRRVHDGQSAILVDVHQDSVEALHEHLLEMRMRKKVHIENMGEELAVVATLTDGAGLESSASAGEGKEEKTTIVAADGASTPTLADQHTECFTDARQSALFPPPLVVTASAPADSAATPLSSPPPAWLLERCVMPFAWAPPLSSAEPYTALLHSRGIGEGPDVFRDNKSLPFEGNLDFLGGVSFHKGCYVGQELTHRTHVMLVTRKRTVPLRFASTRPVKVGEALYTAGKEKIGEVTGVTGEVGVGLLRLRYVDPETQTVPGLQLQDGTPVSMALLDWWPRKEVKKLLKNNK